MDVRTGQEDLEQDNGHFSVPGSEKKSYSISADSPQGEWDKMAEKMMVTLAESGHPVFRATSPLSRGQLKKQRRGPDERPHCDDLRQSGGFTQTVTPTLTIRYGS